MIEIFQVIPVVRPILRPHCDDLERKVQPGMVSLTWQSMNIDAYLERIHLGLEQFDELIDKINDIIDNRIEFNLKLLARTVLVSMPADASFTLQEFVNLQVTKVLSLS